MIKQIGAMKNDQRGFRVNGKTGVCDMQKDVVIYKQAAIDAAHKSYD